MKVKQVKGVVLVSLQLDELDKEVLRRRGDLRERAMNAIKSVIDPTIIDDVILETDTKTAQLALLLTRKDADSECGEANPVNRFMVHN